MSDSPFRPHDQLSMVRVERTFNVKKGDELRTCAYCHTGIRHVVVVKDLDTGKVWEMGKDCVDTHARTSLGAPGDRGRTMQRRFLLPEAAAKLQGVSRDKSRRGSCRVPQDVRREAKLGLSWRAQYGRGGTSVGLRTARLLLRGEVSAKKVRHIARYFPRHAWERRLWWKKPEPSNGRIAWALWGGDAGRRWVNGLIRRGEV